MKPKTVLQKRVAKLAHSLGKITPAQVKYAEDNLFYFYFYVYKHKPVCLECGHRWATEDSPLMLSTLGLICPNCGRKLIQADDLSRVRLCGEYFTVITTCYEYQVIRYYQFTRHLSVLKAAHYSFQEVKQDWINEKGEGIKYGKFLSGYMCWNWSGLMEIRKWSFDKTDSLVYPRQHYLPILRRNGYKGNNHEIPTNYLFIRLLTKPKFETLFKAGQYKLLKHFVQHSDINHWESIKICIRNNYIIEDPTMWLDYIGFLEYFHKDLHNPKLVCPENLFRAHDIYLRRERRAELKRKLEERKAKMIDDEKDYRIKVAKYLPLKFINDQLSIQVLRTVQEYFEESLDLDHCIFTNGYYQKENSLIFSVRYQDKRIASLQLKLNPLEIIQCRGYKNSVPPHYNEILSLMKSHMKDIRKVQLKQSA